MNGNLNNTKTCPNCGITNLANAKFCIKCGGDLEGNNNMNDQFQNNGMDNMNNNNGNDFNNNMNNNFNNNDMNNQFQNNNFDNGMNNMNNAMNNMNNDMNGQFQNNMNMNNNFNNSNNMNNNFNNNFNNNSNNGQFNNNFNNNQVSGGKLDYVKYLLGSFLKPFDTYKNNESALGDFKNSSILALIVVGIMTVISLLSTMLSAVRHKSYFSGKVTWNWDNLGDVEYFKTIGLDLLIYAGIIAAIAGVYYLASLVIKKNAKFSNLIGVATTAVVPFAICSLLISPILSMIYSPLGVAATIVGFVYAFVTLIELVNEIVIIDNKNTRIYYHLVCLSTVIIVGGFVAYKVLLNSVLGGFGDLF